MHPSLEGLVERVEQAIGIANGFLLRSELIICAIPFEGDYSKRVSTYSIGDASQ